MKKLILILALVSLCSNAEAKISRQTVNRAWHRMISASNFPDLPINYESDPDPNAWVLWQDNETFSMHVTTGLIQILDTEDEIAGVLGHEIGHVKCGHYDQMLISDTANTIMSANSGRSEPLSQAIGKIHLDLKDASFSREQETQADDYGAALLKKAGYSPEGLYRALKKLGDGDHNAFSSHPATKERLAHLAQSFDAKESSSQIDDIASALMGR